MTLFFWIILLIVGIVNKIWGLAGLAGFHIAIISYSLVFLMHRQTKTYFNLNTKSAQPVAGGDATR
jgi:hypothetical protein